MQKKYELEKLSRFFALHHMPQRTLKHFSNFDRHSKAFFKTWHVLRDLEHFAKRSKHFATFFEKSCLWKFYVGNCTAYGKIREGDKFPPPKKRASILKFEFVNLGGAAWVKYIFSKCRSPRRFALVFALGYGFWKDWEILPSGNPRRLARFRVFLYAI